MATEARSRSRLDPEVFRLPVERIRAGYYTDAYFNLTKELLEAEGRRPRVTMQAFQKERSVLGGVDEAIAVLRQCSGRDDPVGWRVGWDDLEVRALHEGDEISPHEPVLEIEGDYSLFAHLETVYLGCMARRTLVMRNVREVVEAANGKPILFFPARHDHWLVQTGDGWAAHVAGAIGVSTDAQASWWGGRGVGTVPHALIAAFGGDTVAAASAFAERYADQMNVTVLVDFENDSVRTSLEVADALGERLWGVRLDTSESMVDRALWHEMGDFKPAGVTPELVQRVRSALDAAGHQGVRIVASGGFDAAKIARFEELGASVDSYGVGSSLLRGQNDFTADVVRLEGRDCAKAGGDTGRIPAWKPSSSSHARRESGRSGNQMRRPTLLTFACALVALALAAPAAPAQRGGSAVCSTTVPVQRDRTFGDLLLTKGNYSITVIDTGDLSCGLAVQTLRGFAATPGVDVPEGWDVDAGRKLFVRENDRDAFRVQRLDPAGSDGGFSFDAIENWAVVWLPIIFFAILLGILLMMVRVMPRTKPQEIKPSSSSSVGWDDVAGVEEAKDELREVVEFMRDPKRFRALGARVPKGILLHGPPGTGKTLLAKAVAHESNATFFAQSAASFVEMFVGLGAARIRRLFRQARKSAPAIVFIDELDAVGATRGKDISGEKDQTLNQLLVELDGFGDRDEIVVIAASNMLEQLDPALLRPGRFDRQILVTPPDLNGRREILDVHTATKPLAADVDLDLIARQTSGLSGADLANICKRPGSSRGATAAASSSRATSRRRSSG